MTTTVAILDGTDPATYPRYLSFLVKMPLYQEWIRSATERDAAIGEKQRAWVAARERR